MQYCNAFQRGNYFLDILGYNHKFNGFSEEELQCSDAPNHYTWEDSSILKYYIGINIDRYLQPFNSRYNFARHQPATMFPHIIDPLPEIDPVTDIIVNLITQFVYCDYFTTFDCANTWCKRSIICANKCQTTIFDKDQQIYHIYPQQFVDDTNSWWVNKKEHTILYYFFGHPTQDKFCQRRYRRYPYALDVTFERQIDFHCYTFVCDFIDEESTIKPGAVCSRQCWFSYIIGINLTDKHRVNKIKLKIVKSFMRHGNVNPNNIRIPIVIKEMIAMFYPLFKYEKKISFELNKMHIIPQPCES